MHMLQTNVRVACECFTYKTNKCVMVMHGFTNLCLSVQCGMVSGVEFAGRFLPSFEVCSCWECVNTSIEKKFESSDRT